MIFLKLATFAWSQNVFHYYNVHTYTDKVEVNQNSYIYLELNFMSFRVYARWLRWLFEVGDFRHIYALGHSGLGDVERENVEVEVIIVC